MGTLLIVLSVVWFVLALVFVFALAAAGKRPCPGLESQSNVFVPQIPVTKCGDEAPPFLFGDEEAIPAT